MKHVPILTRRMTLVFLLGILPLTALFCNPSPVLTQGNATATASPTPAPGLAIAKPAGGTLNLQVSWEGNYSMPNGAVAVTYGPDTVTIPLEFKDGTYTGSYAGAFHAAATGLCTATGTFPVTFDITAKEDEFQGLDFTVNRSLTWSWDTVCPGVSGGSTSPMPTDTFTFNLPAEDGASKTYSNPSGGPELTFTLNKLTP